MPYAQYRRGYICVLHSKSDDDRAFVVRRQRTFSLDLCPA